MDEDYPFPSTEMVQRATGLPVRHRLSTNENEFGPAPSVRAAVAGAVDLMHRYPDCDHLELRHLLAARHGVEPEQVYVAAGLDAVLHAVCRTHLGPGRAVVAALGTYPMLTYFARSVGATVVEVPYRDLRCDLPAMAEAAHRHAARVVYVAEPDNPTGSVVGWPALRELHDALPADCLLVVDGAYAEYQDPADRVVVPAAVECGILWAGTFSKAYGLAGMRVGYGVAPAPVLGDLGRGTDHYLVSRLAAVAAEAALHDQGHLTEVVRRTVEGRADYAERLAGLGFEVPPTNANFVLVRPLGRGDRSVAAERLRQGLAGAGVLVRRPSAPGLADLLRLTVGPAAQRDEVVRLFGALTGRR